MQGMTTINPVTNKECISQTRWMSYLDASRNNLHTMNHHGENIKSSKRISLSKSNQSLDGQNLML